MKVEDERAERLFDFNVARAKVADQQAEDQLQFNKERVAAEDKRASNLLEFEKTKHADYVKERAAAQVREESGTRRQVLSSLGFNAQRKQPVGTPGEKLLIRAGRGRQQRLAYR